MHAGELAARKRTTEGRRKQLRREKRNDGEKSDRTSRRDIDGDKRWEGWGVGGCREVTAELIDTISARETVTKAQFT